MTTNMNIPLGSKVKMSGDSKTVWTLTGTSYQMGESRLAHIARPLGNTDRFERIKVELDGIVLVTDVTIAHDHTTARANHDERKQLHLAIACEISRNS